ncbi:SLC8A2 [Symbiodinium microadriaticum]|nr:SLC8A2 [Symbiodinium microadriaticum]
MFQRSLTEGKAPEPLKRQVPRLKFGMFSLSASFSTPSCLELKKNLAATKVCIVAIPAGESRAIEHMPVCLSEDELRSTSARVQVISPNVVEIWEALITFLMFPTLVAISWMANKGKLEFMSLEKKSEEETGLLAASVAEHEPVPATNMRKSHHPRLPNATSTVAGNHRRASQLSATRASQSPATEAPPKEAAGGQEDQPTPAGCMNGKDVNDPKTSEALAAPNGVITFRSDYVEVNNGETSCTEEGGFTLHVEILRFNGCEGRVSCKMELEGLSAVPGKDFLELADNQLVFESGEMSKQVPVKILQQRPEEPDDLLQLVLSEVEGPEEGGVMFNPHDDGGREMALLTIAIKNNPEPPLKERIIDPDNFSRGLEEWKEQILSSIKLEEPEAEENEDPPKLGPMDYVLFVAWNLTLFGCWPCDMRDLDSRLSDEETRP